jgi:hypothetical protein
MAFGGENLLDNFTTQYEKMAKLSKEILAEAQLLIERRF